MKIYSNKGMCLESLINQTALYYQAHNIALIFKRNLPIDIYKVDQKQVNGVLKSKSLTDYYGIYKSIMIDFEAKQTNNDFFLLSNIKQHQLEHLNNIIKHQGISFVILFFVKTNHFYIINTNLINDCIKQKISKINEEWCLNNAFKVELLFPTHLNLESYFKSVIK